MCEPANRLRRAERPHRENLCVWACRGILGLPALVWEYDLGSLAGVGAFCYRNIPYAGASMFAALADSLGENLDLLGVEVKAPGQVQRADVALLEVVAAQPVALVVDSLSWCPIHCLKGVS